MHDNRIKAHIRKGDNGEEIQKLLEHLEQAAIYASDALQRKYFQASVQMIALIHDMGKATVDYQRYLKKAADGEKVVRGSVNHTFAAVRWILERYQDTKRWGRYASFTADLLAYASCAHHGLFDCVDPNHRSGFQNRLEKEGISYEEAVKYFFSECMTEETLDELFAEAVKEVETAIGCIAPQAKIEEEFFFLLGLLGRLLLSAVVEGDRRDTAEFMNDLSFPKFRSQDTLTILWTELSERADSKLDALEQENPIQKARRIISWQCREMAKNGGGVYRLNVPTGAGKTTMVKLLMRFYDVNSGEIKLDGHNLKDYNRNELRNAFGMVLQDTWLFKGSIMENIRYGRLDATDEEVIAAYEKLTNDKEEMIAENNTHSTKRKSNNSSKIKENDYEDIINKLNILASGNCNNNIFTNTIYNNSYSQFSMPNMFGWNMFNTYNPYNMNGFGMIA